jgi:hypothetical protein
MNFLRHHISWTLLCLSSVSFAFQLPLPIRSLNTDNPQLWKSHPTFVNHGGSSLSLPRKSRSNNPWCRRSVRMAWSDMSSHLEVSSSLLSLDIADTMASAAVLTISMVVVTSLLTKELSPKNPSPSPRTKPLTPKPPKSVAAPMNDMKDDVIFNNDLPVTLSMDVELTNTDVVAPDVNVIEDEITLEPFDPVLDNPILYEGGYYEDEEEELFGVYERPEVKEKYRLNLENQDDDQEMTLGEDQIPLTSDPMSSSNAEPSEIASDPNTLAGIPYCSDALMDSVQEDLIVDDQSETFEVIVDPLILDQPDESTVEILEDNAIIDTTDNIVVSPVTDIVAPPEQVGEESVVSEPLELLKMDESTLPITDDEIIQEEMTEEMLSNDDQDSIVGVPYVSDSLIDAVDNSLFVAYDERERLTVDPMALSRINDDDSFLDMYDKAKPIIDQYNTEPELSEEETDIDEFAMEMEVTSSDEDTDDTKDMSIDDSGNLPSDLSITESTISEPMQSTDVSQPTTMAIPPMPRMPIVDSKLEEVRKQLQEKAINMTKAFLLKGEEQKDVDPLQDNPPTEEENDKTIEDDLTYMDYKETKPSTSSISEQKPFLSLEKEPITPSLSVKKDESKPILVLEKMTPNSKDNDDSSDVVPLLRLEKEDVVLSKTTDDNSNTKSNVPSTTKSKSGLFLRAVRGRKVIVLVTATALVLGRKVVVSLLNILR